MSIVNSPPECSEQTIRLPTEFEQKVYSLLATIPVGKVTTYRSIALALGHQGARAVGNACNRNPFAPTIPCHRVVRSNGEVGGYAWGTSEKRERLTREGIRFSAEGRVDLTAHFLAMPKPR